VLVVPSVMLIIFPKEDSSVQQPGPPEQARHVGQHRLADVEAGERLPFQHHHRVALLGQGHCADRARRSATDDDRVEGGVRHGGSPLLASRACRHTGSGQMESAVFRQEL
jgi:hypothetical protein